MHSLRLFAVAVAALGVHVAALASEPARTVQVRSLPRKPTAERIRQFFAGGVSIGESFYESGGSARVSAAGSPSVNCSPPGRWQLTADSIGFACETQMTAGDGTVFPGKRYEESLKVRLVSPEVLVFDREITAYHGRSVSRAVVLVDENCEPTSGKGVARSCAAPLGLGMSSIRDRVLIELMPGSADATLWTQLASHLRGLPADGAPGVFFEGPRAREKREVSEIFFVGEKNEAVASELASTLAPILGPVAIKPWPGDWDYDVVVVVGEKRAPARASAAAP
jgi:hypothetical protein